MTLKLNPVHITVDTSDTEVMAAMVMVDMEDTEDMDYTEDMVDMD